jgi:hypothetical protein
MTVISLGRRLLGGSSSLPGGWDEPDRPASRKRDLLLLGLAPSGVCRANRVASTAGALLPHRFTLTAPREAARRFAFCGTFPSLAAGRCYRPLCPVEPGLSSRHTVWWPATVSPTPFPQRLGLGGSLLFYSEPDVSRMPGRPVRMGTRGWQFHEPRLSRFGPVSVHGKGHSCLGGRRACRVGVTCRGVASLLGCDAS